MTTRDGDGRELVGDLDGSVRNPDGDAGGSVTTTIPDLTAADVLPSSDHQPKPYPSVTAAGADVRGLPPVECPACDYWNLCASGVGSHARSEHGGFPVTVDGVDVRAVDLWELESRGTHPEPTVRRLVDDPDGLRAETRAAGDVRAVEHHLQDRHDDLPDLQLYVHARRQRVEWRPRQWLDDYAAFGQLMRDDPLARFDRRNGRPINYVAAGEVPGGGRS